MYYVAAMYFTKSHLIFWYINLCCLVNIQIIRCLHLYPTYITVYLTTQLHDSLSYTESNA